MPTTGSILIDEEHETFCKPAGSLTVRSQFHLLVN
jgi:hypothetical protein